MKNLKLLTFFTLALFLNIFVYSQNIEFPTNDRGEIIYEGIINIEGASKIGLYNQAIDWFVLNYKSSNDVLQLKDVERAKIIGKGSFTVNHWMDNKWIVNHTITIQAKEGRYKYQISQISFYAPKMSGACSKTFHMSEVKNSCLGQGGFYKLKIKIHNEILSIIQELEEQMKSSSSKENEEDW